MAKILKILGSNGCKKCDELKIKIEKIVEKYHLDVAIEKVEDIEKIMEYEATSFPAVIINDIVAITGRIPDEDEIVEFLSNL